MIPDKFFDFSGLENYHTGAATYSLFWLTVGRNNLTSVQQADLSKDNVLKRKAG